MVALHQPSDRETRRPGISSRESNPERRSSVLVRVPCGRAARRPGLSSSSPVRSMGPTVIPRKKETLTLPSSEMMPVER